MPKESSFLLVSLKDQEAKKLAQVISSDTSRRILDALAQHKATETELAQALQLPLSTVHYNLKQLEAAKLIKADEFHYSEKGREVLHYSLANKYVIIAPEAASSRLLDKLKSILPVIVLMGGISLALQFLKGGAVETYKAVPVMQQDISIRAAEESAKVAAESASSIAAQVPQMAEQAVPTAAQIAPSAMAKVVPAAAQAMPTAPQTAAQAMPTEHVTTTVIHTIQTQPSIALWFFLGAVCAVVLYALVERIRKR